MSTYSINCTTGLLYQIMWNQTVKERPEFSIIEDNSTCHAILSCKTKEAQNIIFQNYLDNIKNKNNNSIIFNNNNKD